MATGDRRNVNPNNNSNGNPPQFKPKLVNGDQKSNFFARRQKIKQQRKSLPIASVEKSLVEEVRKNDVLIIVGETGSGKTTHMAQPLLPRRAHPNPNLTNEQLIPANRYKFLTSNNFYLDFDNFNVKDWNEIVIEIFRRHPLHYALTAHMDAPEVYLQQFWATMEVVQDQENKGEWIQARIDAFHVNLTPDRIRDILRLPQATHGGRQNFEQWPTKLEVAKGIRELGFQGPPTSFSRISVNGFPLIWRIFFIIINRCLSTATKGIRNASMWIIHMFHAVAYNLHVDFAALIYEELKNSLALKVTTRDKKFIPYTRFLKLFIHAALQSNDNIPKRTDVGANPLATDDAYTSMWLPIGVMPPPRRHIPESLLRYVNPAAECLARYRASMEQPEPVVPVPEASPEPSENPDSSPETHRRRKVRTKFRMERGQRSRVLGRGEQRECIERGAGAGPSGLTGAQEVQVEEQLQEPEQAADVEMAEETLSDSNSENSDSLEDVVSVESSGDVDDQADDADSMRTHSSTSVYVEGGDEEDAADDDVTQSPFITRDVLNQALSGIQSAIEDRFGDVFRQLKGKSVASDQPSTTPAPAPAPAPPPPPPTSKLVDQLTVQELQDLLYSRLLAETSPTLEQFDFVTLVRQRQPPTESVIQQLHEGIQELGRKVDGVEKRLGEKIDTLAESVQVLETTCRAESSSRKRRHDHDDDSDDPEGEYRAKRSRTEQGQSGQGQGTEGVQSQAGLENLGRSTGGGTDSVRERMLSIEGIKVLEEMVAKLDEEYIRSRVV